MKPSVGRKVKPETVTFPIVSTKPIIPGAQTDISNVTRAFYNGLGQFPIKDISAVLVRVSKTL